MIPAIRRLVAVALVLLMQGPAMLVQEVAWAKMLVDYTSERGFKRGVIETFDGKHPCKLCAKARELREEENGGQPAERKPQERQIRLSWAEMLPPKWPGLADPAGMDLPVDEPFVRRAFTGRGRAAPGTPPPERA